MAAPEAPDVAVEPAPAPAQEASVSDTPPASSDSTVAAPALETEPRQGAVDEAASEIPVAAAPAAVETPVATPEPEVVPEPAAPVETPEASQPVLEQTVVIPSPPEIPDSMTGSGDRTPRVYGESGSGARIVLRAVQDSWVQVRDSRDALLLTRVLRAGDAYFVPDQAGLTLLTGNAGGIEIEVDGVKAPPLGPVGSVRRQIALDPERLLQGTAVPR
jgi:cytoskeleton protein RodZ